MKTEAELRLAAYVRAIAFHAVYQSAPKVNDITTCHQYRGTALTITFKCRKGVDQILVVLHGKCRKDAYSFVGNEKLTVETVYGKEITMGAHLRRLQGAVSRMFNDTVNRRIQTDANSHFIQNQSKVV